LGFTLPQGQAWQFIIEGPKGRLEGFGITFPPLQRHRFARLTRGSIAGFNL
jgi:hypothetical protein